MDNGLKILVADDLPANRLLVSKHLMRNGHHVIEAGDGQQAIDQFEAEQPDIIEHRAGIRNTRYMYILRGPV